MKHANKAWHACSLIIKQSQQSFGFIIKWLLSYQFGFNVQSANTLNVHDMLHDIPYTTTTPNLQM